MKFEPNYRNFEDLMKNVRPGRLPLYEHIISPNVMEKITGKTFTHMLYGQQPDYPEFFKHYCAFFKDMTYDVVTFEVGIGEILPGRGAILGGKAGPIQGPEDFEKYPWEELPAMYWKHATPRFDALVENLPEGMKAVGGVGNGVFEISEDLVGLELLPFLQMDHPEIYALVHDRIGDTMAAIWKEFMERYNDSFVACRFGDDLGFKCSLLTNPATVRENIMPQYKKVIDIIHAAGNRFLWHSCGCIFEIMEDAIACGIDAKHSNEDAISPYSRWIEDYGKRIGLLGGFDLDFICQQTPERVFKSVRELGHKYRDTAQGYGLGSGNSIPDYVPVENYLAMVKGAQAIRKDELA